MTIFYETSYFILIIYDPVLALLTGQFYFVNLNIFSASLVLVFCFIPHKFHQNRTNKNREKNTQWRKKRCKYCDCISLYSIAIELSFPGVLCKNQK